MGLGKRYTPEQIIGFCVRRKCLWLRAGGLAKSARRGACRSRVTISGIRNTMVPRPTRHATSWNIGFGRVDRIW